MVASLSFDADRRPRSGDYENNPADFFLTEVSGIPFGLIGEMLQGGGNPWRGMIFGMTNRMPWSDNADPRPIWKAWDNFGIEAESRERAPADIEEGEALQLTKIGIKARSAKPEICFFIYLSSFSTSKFVFLLSYNYFTN